MTIDYRIRNIVIAAVLAAAAVLLTVIYVTSARNDVATGKENVTVYVPSQDFSVGAAGSKIAGSLDKQTVARKNAAPEAVVNPTQIEGLYLTQPVYKGEQLTLNRFALPKEQGIRAELKGNQRALQVPGTADQVLAGTLNVGDRVDVVAILKDPKDNTNVKSSIVLRNLRVLETEDASGSSKLSQRRPVAELGHPRGDGRPGPAALLRDEERRLDAAAAPRQEAEGQHSARPTRSRRCSPEAASDDARDGQPQGDAPGRRHGHVRRRVGPARGARCAGQRARGRRLDVRAAGCGAAPRGRRPPRGPARSRPRRRSRRGRCSRRTWP